MSQIEQFQKMKRMDYFIRIKGTGTPEKLADKLTVSRATIFRYLVSFKEMGAPICYCKERQSYYYKEDFEFSIEMLFLRGTH